MENVQIVTVAPISKTLLNEDLTYFTTKEISTGNMVVISIRNKDTLGIVTSVRPADTLKSEIKISEFGFKKIKKILHQKTYLQDFVDASAEAAKYFASSSGQIIRLLTPRTILADWESHHFGKKDKLEFGEVKNRRFEVSVLGMLNEDRYSFYKSLIREEFARKHSVVFILPTIHDVEEYGEILKRGIEGYTVIMHSRLSAKIISERWNNALSENHPILIVSTPIFLSLPRGDVGTIIIDKENSQFYKTMSRPFLDLRKFAEILAKKRPARLILGDSITRIEDIYNSETGGFIQESPLKYRFSKNIYQEVIDMRKSKGDDPILSPKVKRAILEAFEKREHSLLICTRKGLGTSTVCSDCGEIIICDNCSLPMLLYSSIRGENVFYCNKCGARSSTDVKCLKCSSWKLKVLGIATERVEEEIRTVFPAIKIFRIDSNIAKNYKQARSIVNDFLKTPGAILVGTEMVLNYLNEEIDTVAVISVDTLFSIPDFRINENVFNLLMRLRIKTLKRFLIQTRKPDERVFTHVINGDLLEFYREEIRERKRFSYPPFKILIKITAEGPANTTNKEMLQLERFLHNYQPDKFNAFIEKINNKERVNILLKIDPERWPPLNSDSLTRSEEHPYSNLLEILMSLPKRFLVKIDAENIL